MFESNHASFTDQPDAQAHVWRYMDLARYLSLLDSQALHFSRADQMKDKWEGGYGKRNRAVRPGLYGEHYSTIESQRPSMRAYLMERMHMSCWHLSEIESAAMWEIYQSEGRGVAVKSSWGALTASITSERSVYGARIQYIDYSTQFVPEGNVFEAFLRKRESFRHEQEVRLLMMTGNSTPHPEHPNEALDLGPEGPVLPVSVNLGQLIESVYVAPDAPAWIGGVVKSVTQRYGFRFPVHQSDLATDPLN